MRSMSISRRLEAGVPRLMKRVTDIGVAAILLILLLPVFLVVAVLVKLSSPGPIFFRQVRIGRRGESFEILKFRSMLEHTYIVSQRDVYACVDKPFIWIGRWCLGDFLRQTKLDELPQFINILREEMSLVGLRPLSPDCDPDILELRRAAGLKDCWVGLSGKHQVYEDHLDVTRRIALEREYFENWSYREDLRILWRTVSVVLSIWIRILRKQ